MQTRTFRLLRQLVDVVTRLRPLCLGLLVFSAVTFVGATPLTPSRDDEVIEVLPAIAGNRSDERRIRRQLETSPRDAGLALRLAQRFLDQAHELGDPRFAGLALAAIAAWTDDPNAPDGVMLMRATLQQYLHEFTASVTTLEELLKRTGARARPQPWLTLATVHRVQGRYHESDEACRQVVRAGAQLHGDACLAENAALRGEVESARAVLQRLLASPDLSVATQAWLLTTVAELEQRDGRADAADRAFRAVLARGRDAYAAIAYADFLIDQGRPGEALQTLKREPRTDAVVLRLAVAGTRARTIDAPGDVAEMRARIALANERPEARKVHGREQAMFALDVDRRADEAYALALGNIEQQREPSDLLVLAEAARATGKADALDNARRWRERVGLHDRRIESLLSSSPVNGLARVAR